MKASDNKQKTVKIFRVKDDIDHVVREAVAKSGLQGKKKSFY